MAPKKSTKKAYPDSIVGLTTQLGETLLIRANPTDAAVKGFVEEHTRRYIAGEPGGPSGIPAFRIFTAKRYENEEAFLADAEPVAEIDITALLPTS